VLVKARRDEQGDCRLEEGLGARRQVFEEGDEAWCRQRVRGRRCGGIGREENIVKGIKVREQVPDIVKGEVFGDLELCIC